MKPEYTRPAPATASARDAGRTVAKWYADAPRASADLKEPSTVAGRRGRRRLTSRVHGSGMEAEQLHLVFLAFAFPRFRGDGDGCVGELHDGGAARGLSLSDPSGGLSSTTLLAPPPGRRLTADNRTSGQTATVVLAPFPRYGTGRKGRREHLDAR